MAGTLTALLIGGAFMLLRPQLTSAPGPAFAHSTDAAPISPAGDSLAAALSAAPVSTSVLKANAELVAAVRPTHGAPIDLIMFPSGVNLVLHLRPAQLWSSAAPFHELRGALTQTVTDWIAMQFETHCRRKPEQIEEALIGVLLGPTGSTPEVAVVIRLKEPAKLSDLVEEFRGEPVRPDGSLRLFKGETQAYFIRDERTVAICPAALAEDLADWVDTPNQNTTDGILQLLSETDRERLFSVLFEVDDVRRHANWLVASEARPALEGVLELFGEESETVCWSLHLGDDLYSELHVRTRVAGSQDILGPRALAELLSRRMTAVPQQLLAKVRTLNPQHSGARQLIGRLPAMSEAVRRGTVATTAERRVQFTTLLPAKAAPNLALATLLAWDEWRRMPTTGSATPSVAGEPAASPQTVAERLKLPVDAEFRRTPLRDAFAYICSEIGVKLNLDGDALKDAGYTQNMPQTFNLGIVAAEVALSQIVSQYDGDGKDELQMVVVVDEAGGQLHVTTRKFADLKGLTPATLPAPPE